MEMNPQRVRTAEFRTVKRGLDASEVQSFLNAVADELERAQNQSTAMEARARAAVARLQELSDDAGSQSDASAEILRPSAGAAESDDGPAAEVRASVDEVETISRTLLLAQRTADTTIAEAEGEALRLRAEAEAEAEKQIGASREMAGTLLNEARAEARKVGEEERKSLAGEVDSLVARREFLESDVDHLEQFLVDQRSRLREAANEIVELTERVPSGLGDARRPLLSAADDETSVEQMVTTEPVATSEPVAGMFSEVDDVSDDTPNDTPNDVANEELWLPDAADEPMPVIEPDSGWENR